MKKINKILFKSNHKENNPKLPHPSPNTSANYSSSGLFLARTTGCFFRAGQTALKYRRILLADRTENRWKRHIIVFSLYIAWTALKQKTHRPHHTV